MKKLYFVGLLAVLAFSLLAQTPKDEAIQSLDNAKLFMQQDNLAKAQDEINYASGKISEILSEVLVKYLPDAPAGFTVEDKSAQGMGQMGGLLGSANAVAATGKYNKENSDGSTSSISLTITIGGLMGKTAGLAAMGQMFAGYGSGTNTKTIRVGGYTATQDFSAGDSSSSLTVQVGDKVSILVEGDSLSSPDIMKALVEKIDLAKLEKAF
ncbi:MAG: hypothetical protein RBS43_05915 [Candidatus Cloacimonas sp.]|nr:hypothetical protein [Candidatus Cloacimonas sp.]